MHDETLDRTTTGRGRVADLTLEQVRRAQVVRGDGRSTGEPVPTLSEALEAAGYPIVLHVYDEDIAEVPEGWGSLEEFEAIMSTMPPWAAGWPVRASGGWRGRRYRKG